MSLASLQIADEPAIWSALGFTVTDGVVRIGRTDLELAGTSGLDPAWGAASGTGITSWTLTGGVTDTIDGLPTRNADEGPPAVTRAASSHRNGVVAIDHVVVVTPDLDRTIDALAQNGFELRRVRDAGGGRTQAFFWIGDIVLEVVGDPQRPSGPAQFMGLALVSDDLEATAAYIGPERCTTPKEAVQKGRRICGLTKAAAVSTPIAFMTAHVRA